MHGVLYQNEEGRESPVRHVLRAFVVGCATPLLVAILITLILQLGGTTSGTYENYGGSFFVSLFHPGERASRMYLLSLGFAIGGFFVVLPASIIGAIPDEEIRASAKKRRAIAYLFFGSLLLGLGLSALIWGVYGARFDLKTSSAAGSAFGGFLMAGLGMTVGGFAFMKIRQWGYMGDDPRPTAPHSAE